MQIVGTVLLALLKGVIGKLIEYAIMKKKIADDSKVEALKEQVEAKKQANAIEDDIKQAQEKLDKKAKEAKEAEQMLETIRGFREEK